MPEVRECPPIGPGPHCRRTSSGQGYISHSEKILDILKKHNVRATFFVNGKASESSELEPLYRDIAEDGHALGMHSYSHKYSEIYSSREAFETDLDKIHSLIYNETVQIL